MEVIGIVPAAGRATRLAPFPCPKELFPIGFQDYCIGETTEKRPKVVSQYIIENMCAAGIEKIFMIVGKGKDDVIEYYGDGRRFGCRIAYLYQERLNGIPFAVDLARPWIGDATVVFAMPDTIVRPQNALAQLLERHLSARADLSLGLFYTDRPDKFGMVEIDQDSNVLSTIDKPRESTLELMWGTCCWSPSFTALLAEFVESRELDSREAVLGDVFDEALGRCFAVKGFPFEDGRYFDIGTADGLNAALREFHGMVGQAGS